MHNIVAPYPYPNKSWSPGQGESHTSVFMFPVEYNLVSGGDVEMKYKYDEVADIWFKEYLLKDHMGNIRQRIKWDGLIETNTQLMDYLPFGETRAVPGTLDITDDWTGWLGNSHDYESDLSDFNARMYDPEIGRFMAIDELWGQQLGINSYHYGHNNPIAMADPSGYDDYYFGPFGHLERVEENTESDNLYSINSHGDIINSLINLDVNTISNTWKIDGMFALEIKSESNAQLVFEFLTDSYNQYLEYELYLGNNGNLLGTSGLTFERTSDFIYDMASRYKFNNINLFKELSDIDLYAKVHNHNYTNGAKGYSEGDLKTIQGYPLINHFVKYGIDKYYPYSPFE